MYNFPIGVITNSFRLPFEESLDKAVEVGAQGIQLYTAYGEMAPENLTPSRRKEILNSVKSRGLCFSALCGDFQKGFTNPELNPELIEKSKRVLDLAMDLETNIVTTHIGVVPEDENNPTYEIMQKACFELASYADSLKAHFAIETGPEKSATLKKFLDSLNSTGVAVNLDPANLVMVVADDPVQAVYNLQKYIVHTHAKDGVKLGYTDPNVLYGDNRTEEEFKGKDHKEVPLGTGSVDFAKYLKALEDIGYRGYLTIEREVGENPAKDIKTAVDFLKATIANN